MLHSTFGSGNAYEQKTSMNLTDEYVWREMTLGDVHKLHDEVHPFLYKTFLSADQFRNFNVTSFKVELRKAINVQPQEMLEMERDSNDDFFTRYDKIKKGLKHAKKVMQKNLEYKDTARTIVDLKTNPLQYNDQNFQALENVLKSANQTKEFDALCENLSLWI